MKPQAIGLRRMMVAAVMGACATGLMVAAMSSGSAVAQNNPAATPAQAADNSADGTLPTVYSEENTGASFRVSYIHHLGQCDGDRAVPGSVCVGERSVGQDPRRGSRIGSITGLKSST